MGLLVRSSRSLGILSDAVTQPRSLGIVQYYGVRVVSSRYEHQEEAIDVDSQHRAGDS